MKRTLKNAVRGMLLHSGMLDEFCAECLMMAFDVRNCVPKADRNKSLLE